MITYLMHISWYWAKQRPHFIAEGLHDKYSIKVFFTKNYNSSKLSTEIRIPSFAKEIFKFPFGRYVIIKLMNKILYLLQVFMSLQKNKYVWITHPRLYMPIKKIISSQKIIIYDCMDDILEFPTSKKNSKLKTYYEKAERELVNKADYIFCSSSYLRAKIQKRYNLTKKIVIVRNGINLRTFQNNKLIKEFELPKSGDNLRLLYLGTISEWMDFDLIVKSTKRFDFLDYYLVGPKEINIPSHKNIKHLGPVKHDTVHSVLKSADILVMPFKLNELILSVNPVKLYEYLYVNKPIISVKYQETELFSDFVYLYNSENEYFKIIESLKNSLKPKQVDRQSILHFLGENSWEKRIDLICKEINLS